MSAVREEALSPDELRKRLYQTFKNRGVLDTLKTQLRNQLIQELKHPHVSRGDTVPRLVSLKSDCLLVSACNSLVADHLRTSGYEYTLSVFYPESGLSKDKVFTTGDLLQLMKISPESTLYRSLTVNKQKDRKGFLISLLTELTGYYTHGVCCDADTQTTTSPTYRGSLVEKMKMIDQEYDSLHSRGDQWVSYESKLAGYRKDIDAQMHAEIHTKMQHFKDVEIATVKMEEKAKSRKEFEQLRRDMERTYEMKAEALIKREKNAIERLQKQQEIEEKGIYMQRQELLKEIETVRNRENELKMRMESFEKTCQIHKEKIKTTEELLRRRELAVKTLEDTYDQNLKNELSRYQRELDEGFVKRTQKLTENETINNVETARIQKESAAVNAKIEEHNKACSELRRLQIELDTSQQQASLLSQQKELLRDRLETMKDYPSLKREKVELQGQLRLLKKQLEEVQEENRLFRGDLGKPSVEQLALQTELRRLQNARRLDEEEFDNQRQVLQAQLQSEVERCAQLKAQLIECEERAQWMNTHAQETKMQLSQTQQALEREVLRNPKPSLVDRSILELSADKLLPPDIYVDRALLEGRVGHDDDDGVCEAAGGPMRWRRSHPARTDSPDSDSEWLAGAKSRIRELERESDNLEEVYRNYQQRALHSMRPHSPQQVHPIPFSHRTRPRSPQRPQVSSRPLSPQHLYTVTSCPAPQQKVTFFAEQQQISGSPSSAEPRFRADGCPREDGSSPSRRLSSTPRSLSSKQLQTELIEVAVSPVPFPDLSPERHPSPAPRGGVVSSGDSSADLSPPRSPQLKSTARDQRSPQKVQRVSSSTESSPQPEKISLQDLTETLPEPSRIPEPLLDTAIPLSEEPPDGPAVAPLQAPRDLPDTQIHTQKHGGVVEGQQRPGEPSAPQEDEEDEELRWERERRERQDRRQREIEEAKEWELRELERLEKETAFEEVVQCGLGVEEEAKERGRHEEEEDKKDEETGGQKSSGGDPLEKYMKLVLEAREKQHAQSPGQEEPQHMSPDFKSLSEEKDDSIAVYSHEAVDDDFW